MSRITYQICNTCYTVLWIPHEPRKEEMCRKNHTTCTWTYYIIAIMKSDLWITHKIAGHKYKWIDPV